MDSMRDRFVIVLTLTTHQLLLLSVSPCLRGRFVSL